MTRAQITLECFDDAGAADPEPSFEYKRGLSDGLAQADASESARSVLALNEIASTLTDMSFGFEEARLHVMRDLHPLLGQIAEAILPFIAQETFGAHLIEEIERNFTATTDKPVKISTAPNMVATINDILTDGHFTFVGDPSLDAGQALIRQDETYTLLDLPALVLALQTALNGFERPERIHSNG